MLRNMGERRRLTKKRNSFVLDPGKYQNLRILLVECTQIWTMQHSGQKSLVTPRVFLETVGKAATSGLKTLLTLNEQEI